MTRGRAVVARSPGGPEVLAIDTVEVRDPGPGEIAVRVRAAGVNRADLLQRRGMYPPPPGAPADVLGLEYAGEVEACGPLTARFRPGDRVMGIVGGGGQCERVLVHEREAISVPAGMSWTDAAAIPEAFLTAFDALVTQGGLATGQWVLVHAAASGVGTAAVQLVRAANARCIGTSRTAAKLDRVRRLGLDEALAVADGRFAERCRALTDGRGVELIIDFVGAAYLGENIAALAPGGRVVVLGLLGGSQGELPLGIVLTRRLTLIGSTLRGRPIEEKIALARAFEARGMPLFAAGRIRPVVDAVLPLERVREAHERLERNDTVGKIVLTL